MISQKQRNWDPCSAFAKWSPIIFKVEQNSADTSSFVILSVINNTLYWCILSACYLIIYQYFIIWWRSSYPDRYHCHRSSNSDLSGSIGSISPGSGHNTPQQARPQLKYWCSVFVVWIRHLPLMLPWSWNQRCGSSCPCAQKIMHQRTTAYF